jgi:hypothetical protein
VPGLLAEKKAARTAWKTQRIKKMLTGTVFDLWIFGYLAGGRLTSSDHCLRIASMFNVIISGEPKVWETDQLMRMDVTRFKEYSGGPEADKINITKFEVDPILWTTKRRI